WLPGTIGCISCFSGVRKWRRDPIFNSRRISSDASGRCPILYGNRPVMRLQVSTRLAIFALLHLAAGPDRQMSVSDIGDKYGVSNHHLAKVMHVLGRAGLVRAARGAGGGYQFSGNANRTTLLDVTRLFEDWAAPEAIPD